MGSSKVDIGALGQQQTRNIKVASLGCNEQCSGATQTRKVNVGSLGKQQLCHSNEAMRMGCDDVQRGLSSLVSLADVGSPGRKQPNRGVMAVLASCSGVLPSTDAWKMSAPLDEQCPSRVAAFAGKDQ